MNIFKVIAIAFSLFSRIPMPKFEWEDKDMRYSISAFPWVGAVVGAVYFAVFYFGRLLSIPDIALALIMTAVPVILTGGFHIDGYMDTKDALNSYKPREEKLEILKDPHTGAFAVIWLAACGLVFVAMQYIALSLDNATIVIGILACSFFLARCQSAFDVIFLSPAKKDGMLRHESDESLKARKVNVAVLVINTLIVVVGMCFISPIAAAIAVVVTILWNLIYAGRCKRIFGGITGDTAGYFLVKCELYIAVAVVLVSKIFPGIIG